MELKKLAVATSISYVFLSCIIVLPSYLYRFVWRVAWFKWSPFLLLSFLVYLSPIFWGFFENQLRLNGRFSLYPSLISATLWFLIPLIKDFLFRGLLICISLVLVVPGVYWVFKEFGGLIFGYSLSISFALEVGFRSVALAIDYRFTFIGLFLFLGIIMVILHYILFVVNKRDLESRFEASSSDVLGLDPLVSLILAFEIFLIVNLFSRPNTLLRLGLVDYNLIDFVIVSFLLVLAFALTPIFQRLILERLKSPRVFIDVGGVLVVLSVALLFNLRGYISVLLSTLAAFVLSFALILTLGNCEGRMSFLNWLTLSMVVLLLLSMFYSFVFVYPYLPGIYLFGKKSFELFSIASILLISVLSYWFWVKRYRLVTVFNGHLWKVSLIIFIIVTPLVFYPASYSVGAAAPNDGTIRVMSYNIHQGYGDDYSFSINRVLEVIKSSGAEVIGLQEVDTGRITSDYLDTLLYLSAKLGYYAVFEPAIGGTYGVAVLSKYPLERVRGIQLTSTGEQRVMLHVLVDLGFVEINFVTLHLGLDGRERLIQIWEVLNYTTKIEGPTVIVGDFNAHPDSSVIGLVKDHYIDAREVAAEVYGPIETSPAGDPVERIDYIFVNNYFNVTRFETIISTASDHLPVVADLVVKPKLELSGSMYANDAGEPRGGFEWAAEYNATIRIFGDGEGFIEFELYIGLGDPLEESRFLVEGFGYNESHMWMWLGRMDGSKRIFLTLKYYESDPVWGIYNGYYIAHYIDPTLFPGFSPHFYVELRINLG